MDEKKGLSGSELCRLCLKKAGASDLFEIKDLVQDIYLCTGVKVIRSNNLPRKICIQCLRIVTNAKQLRLMVKENEMHMKVLFDHEENETEDINQLNNEKDTSIHTTESRTSMEENDTSDNKADNIKRRIRQSSVSENEIPKKIAVRKDLFTSSLIMNSPSKDCTYIEGTKYGISKTFTVNETNDVKVTYTCAMCPKTFSSWKKVYCHQRMHNKHIECPKDSCRKKFATKGDLDKHMRTHTGERPFVCDICEKSFSQRGTLRVHKENVHYVSGESLVFYVKE